MCSFVDMWWGEIWSQLCVLSHKVWATLCNCYLNAKDGSPCNALNHEHDAIVGKYCVFFTPCHDTLAHLCSVLEVQFASDSGKILRM